MNTKYENNILGHVNAERIVESTTINPELRRFLTGQGYTWLVNAGDVKVPLTAEIFENEFKAVRETASAG